MENLDNIFREISANWNEDQTTDIKRELKRQVFKATASVLRCQGATEKIKNHDLVFMLLTKILEEARNSGCEDNLISFLHESKYFGKVLFTPSRFMSTVYTMNSRTFLKFFTLTQNAPYEIRVCIFGQLLYCLKRDAQIFLLNDLKNTRSDISYDAMVDAIFSGVLRYDEDISERMHREMEKLDENELAKAHKGNPVYVLCKLFVYGFIDEYDLKKYEDLIYKAPMLKLCLYPAQFDWDSFPPPGWEKLELDRRILAQKEKNIFPAT